ncbi:MAG: flavodoxin family protein [Candidatus Bathyarchaeia archaeon]
MKVLGVVFSPRKNGNTEILVQEALKGAEEMGADTELVATRELNINPCDGCGSCQKSGVCRINDDMQKMYEKLLDADGIILGTPVYFWQMCAQAKTFIDRTYALTFPNLKLANKVGAAIAVAGRTGAVEVLNTLSRYFINNHMIVAESVEGLASEKGSIVNDERGMRSARELGKQVALLIKLGNRFPEEYEIPIYRLVHEKYKAPRYPRNT